MQDSIRLNKFISDSGFCSRREADKIIEDGGVRINGRPATTGSRINPCDDVEVNGQAIRAKRKKDTVYIAYNKPEGITCTTESNVRGNIIDAIRYPVKIFPIGRLDKFSQGLIFLTNDGDIVNKILRAGNAHEKEYLVTIDRPVTDDFVRKMSNGVPILDTVTEKCKVSKEGKFGFRITLTQGLNRQIRRMCEYLGYRVTSLSRMRIMNVNLGKLKSGSWRHLTPAEMEMIMEMTANSSKTNEASRDRNRTTGKSTTQRKSQPKVWRRDDKKSGDRKQSSSKGSKTSAKGNRRGGKSTGQEKSNRSTKTSSKGRRR